MPRRLLLVDDDAAFCRAFARTVRPMFETTCAQSADEALVALRGAPYEVAVVDILLRDSSGIELIRLIHRDHPAVGTFAISGAASPAVIVDAVRAGATDFLLKTPDRSEVVQKLCNFKALRSQLTLDQARRDHILRVLAECRGCISDAARRLAIPRTSLQRMLKKI